MAETVPGGGGRVLEAAALCKSYGAVDVLRDIDLAMERGDFLVLVGPSGCGKSTLLNCIAGLETITSGTLSIAGRDVTEVPPKDRDIAMVFQSYALYPTMTVGENIGFGMKIRRIPKPEIDAAVSRVAELLQIGHLLDRRPSQLSGGQRQRVAMGRALVRAPQLFLFDEPLSNLDAKLRVEMRAEIRRLHRQTGASIVYVTHDQIEAMTLATQIVVLKDGAVQQIGTPDEIYDAPANTFVADFMGSPPMNLVPATLGAGGIVDFGGGQSVPLPEVARVARRHREVIVGIRPERMALTGAGEGGLEVRPTMVEHTGSDTFVTFALGGATATARVNGRFPAGIGEGVGLRIDPEALSVFDPENGRRL